MCGGLHGLRGLVRLQQPVRGCSKTYSCSYIIQVLSDVESFQAMHLPACQSRAHQVLQGATIMANLAPFTDIIDPKAAELRCVFLRQDISFIIGCELSHMEDGRAHV